jgi:hypothetical protein
MTKEPPQFHGHEAMVPPHENSPHAIPVEIVSVGARGKIDLRQPNVCVNLTLKGKTGPLVYEMPRKPKRSTRKARGSD